MANTSGHVRCIRSFLPLGADGMQLAAAKLRRLRLYSKDQEREPGGSPEGGRFAGGGSGGNGLADSWTGMSGGGSWAKDVPVGSDGKYHFFHGTTEKNAKGIMETGLKLPHGVGPGWGMVTTNQEEAGWYARGYDGDRVVEFAMTKEEAAHYLTQPHTGTEVVTGHGTGAIHGLLRGEIPAKFIVGVRTMGLGENPGRE